MVKSFEYPILSASNRKIRAHIEWKVLVHTLCEPRYFSIRSFISFAALLVKVIAKILYGSTPFSMRWHTLAVSTRVFPLPAPAITKTAPSVSLTAASCWGLRLKLFIAKFYRLFATFRRILTTITIPHLVAFINFFKKIAQKSSKKSSPVLLI